jgi:hypothetical protein
MTEEIDINKVAAEFVQQNIESFYNTGKGVLKGATDKVRLFLSSSYHDYLTCVAERYSKAKSFFIRDKPTYLYDFYTPIGISCGGMSINETSVRELVKVNPFTVVTGWGGSGKSMLMRHLFIDAIIQKEKIPIFLELRELNQTEQSLLEFVRATLHSNRFELDDEYIEKAMKAGHFIFILDGFDEVQRALRKSLSRQIHQLAKNYDRNLIVVSSRPDNEFAGWQLFSVCQMNALTLEQATELVEKLPFETEFKLKFIKDLRERLFEEHKSFLSNPLLLSIMLLTYGQSADIPNKISLFYNQAYEALFQRHDALKGAFQRDRSCSLDIQDFAKVFSAFSLQTYDKRVFSFSKSDALDYVNKSKKLLSLEFNIEDYLEDAKQAVCLLIEDGLLITFSHRSFQEYFVARFILDSKPDIQKKLIDKYQENIGADDVMELLYEMSPELVERTFIIPYIEKLERSIGVKNKVGITHYLRYIKAEYDYFEIRDNTCYAIFKKNYSYEDVVSFILDKCGDLVDWSKFKESVFEEPNWLKYSEVNEMQQIKVSTLTTRDSLVRDLAFKGKYLSIKPLEAVLNIKKALIQKHQNADKSLEAILEG